MSPYSEVEREELDRQDIENESNNSDTGKEEEAESVVNGQDTQLYTKYFYCK